MGDAKANVKGFFKRFKENRDLCEQQEKRQQQQQQQADVGNLMHQVSRTTISSGRNQVSRSGHHNLSPVDPSMFPTLLPPKQPRYREKNLLVLDLDETLVHSSFKPVPQPSTILPIEIDGNVFQVYVKKRPFLHEFIRKISDMFEICIFTASLSKYADPLLDELDPGRELLGRHRLFREQCSHTNGAYVKDLSLIGRPLETICIIDNSPVAYLFQVCFIC